MYQSLKREFFWQSVALDDVLVVRSCTPCAKKLVQLRRHIEWLQLISAMHPLGFVAFDILGPFRKSKYVQEYLLVITDRYSNLTRSVPLRTITAHAVAKAIGDH